MQFCLQKAVGNWMSRCHEFFQNSNSGNCQQIEWNIKWPLTTWKEDINNTVRTNGGTDGPKLVSLKVFKVYFIVSATFEIILGRHVCLRTKLWFCNLKVISQFSFSKKGRVIGVNNEMNLHDSRDTTPLNLVRVVFCCSLLLKSLNLNSTKIDK